MESSFDGKGTLSEAAREKVINKWAIIARMQQKGSEGGS